MKSESTHCGRRTGEEADTVTGSLLRTSRRSTPEKNQRTLKTTIGLWTKTGFNKALLWKSMINQNLSIRPFFPGLLVGSVE